MNTAIKNYIKNHAQLDFPNECCGFIAEKNNKIIPIKCNNISRDKQNNFEISPLDFLKTKKLSDKILYIYHSHTNKNFNFSLIDKIYAENLCLNSILYCYFNDNFYYHESNSFDNQYIGRFYEHKKYDCFTLVEDFFKNEFNFIFNYDRNLYLDNQKDINIKQIVLDFYEINNFLHVKDNNLETYDVILMNGIFGEACHFAIYLGDNKILHHPINKFSRIDEYSKFYKKNTNFIFRKKDL